MTTDKAGSLRTVTGCPAITAKDIYGAALPQLEEMVKWFEVQEDYCFYGCSVLLTYEGTATKPEDLAAMVEHYGAPRAAS